MRMTKNKLQVIEALAFVDKIGSCWPPYTAVSVQRILQDELGYGQFDMPNLTRTLKALVDQGLVKMEKGVVELSGQTGCIDTGYNFEQVRWQYWPADMDLEAIRPPPQSAEEYELSMHNFVSKLCGAPEITMEEYQAEKARKASIATCQ